MTTKEFEKQTLDQLLIDLKDIDNYKSFRKGAFVYDLGHYQGQLLINEINRLNNIISECANEILKELQENNHLSYGVALAIRQKLINYNKLKGDNK